MQMENKSAQQLAEYYLKKHLLSEHKLGLGPYMEAGESRLFAGSDVSTTGSMIMDILSSIPWECRSITEDLYADILQNHPELKPKIMMLTGRGGHFWAEITDPKTGRQIQIDATPWYGCLNPGHVGEETDRYDRISFTHIEYQGGPPFSYKKVDVGSISIYLVGFLPRFLFANQMQNEAELQKIAEYRFVFQIVLAETFQADPQRFVQIFLNIPSTESLQTALCGSISIEEMIRNRVVQIGNVKFFSETRFMDFPVKSFDQLKQRIRGLGNEDLILEFERNLPRVVRLLEKTRPVLDIHGDISGAKVDVRTGRPLALSPEVARLGRILRGRPGNPGRPRDGKKLKRN